MSSTNWCWKANNGGGTHAHTDAYHAVVLFQKQPLSLQLLLCGVVADGDMRYNTGGTKRHHIYLSRDDRNTYTHFHPPAAQIDYVYEMVTMATQVLAVGETEFKPRHKRTKEGRYRGARSTEERVPDGPGSVQKCALYVRCME